MTPTLLGRIQTRILLFGSVGALVSFPFGAAGLLVLFVALILGMLWDILYNFIQKLLWDRDWPAALQLAAGIWEGLVLLALFPGVFNVWHYSLVWLSVFVASQSIMRLMFPRWRFRGGRWL
ncbi:MAG: hypothetical protein AAF974_02915 [Cyanobacteria bacterium P01_E01_bin.34]